MGFNGSVPGPTIEVNEGDRARVIVENRLPEMTAVHWHGFEVPMEMDGSVGLGQDPIPPGGTIVYEWELRQHGTFFYHSHFAMQEMMGMIGLFIMHPKEPYRPAVDRDFGLVLQEWALLPNNNVPNTAAMEFNWLSFNGKSGPDCTPMIVKQGERVRIRMMNIGMDHHPIHLHGMQFLMTGTEGGRVPEPLWYPMTPVTRGGHGLHTGAGMQEGMGILGKGAALSEEFGLALGRGMGVAADRDRATSHLASQSQPAQAQAHAHHGAGAGAMYPQDDLEKKKVPGYPQDMWMTMDEVIAPKPENHGLRKGWTGSMMEMMTLVRVVTPEVYDKIMELKKAGPAAAAPHRQHWK